MAKAKELGIKVKWFQTKLTYGMICYGVTERLAKTARTFQTKLTYGMICYFNRRLMLFITLTVSN